MTAKVVRYVAFLLAIAVTLVGAQKKTESSSTTSRESCNETLAFCWFGPYPDGSDEVNAWGTHWVSSDKTEAALEWITEVRCMKSLKICILARNQQSMTKRITNIDLYYVTKWGESQVEATKEEADPCETDSLLLNKVGQTASMLSVPGPRADSKTCTAIMKPKTVIYQLSD